MKYYIYRNDFYYFPCRSTTCIMDNVCPRVHRAVRKSAAIGIIVSVAKSIIVFILTIYMNDLLANADKRQKNLVDTLELKNKRIPTNNNCTCSSPISSECDTYCNINRINDLCQKQHTKIKIFAAMLLLFAFIILSTIVLQYIVCVPKHQPDTFNAERNINTSQQYISVQTQTLQDDLFMKLGEYVMAKDSRFYN